MTDRAHHVGSLLRPPDLLEARAAHERGDLSAEALAAAEDAAVGGAVARQRETGLGLLTDGEFRRASFSAVVWAAVEGFSSDRADVGWKAPPPAAGTPGPRTPPPAGGGTLPHVVGPLRARGRLAGREAAYLRDHAGGPFKVTLPSPSLFANRSFLPGVTDAVYATRGEMLDALGTIVNAEARALAADGAACVQLDAPSYTVLADPARTAALREQGIDPEKLLEDMLRADRAALAGLDALGVERAVHLCRGNFRSRWIAEGSYDPIAERVFAELDCDTLLLEYDDDRAGGFGPLRHVPTGTTVVLGLVTTKRGALEDEGELLARVREAARVMPLERLAVSPQCGFASSAPGNLLTHDDQWRKLELVVRVAERVWR